MVNQPLRRQVSDCEAVRLAGGWLAYLLPSAGREIDHPQSSPHHKSPQSFGDGAETAVKSAPTRS